MCPCCPQAVTALFCLLARSGFSKASVAGALMFFPPEPSLYTFKRYDSDGNPIDDDDDESVPDETDDKKTKNKNKNSNKSKSYDLCDNNDAVDNSGNDVNVSTDLGNLEEAEFQSTRTGKKPDAHKKSSIKNSSSKNSANGPVAAASNSSDIGDNSDYGQYYEEDHIQDMNLAERAAQLRKRGLVRNKKDARDAKRGVTYKFIPDARLMAPPAFTGTIDAIKIGPDSKTDTYVAAVVYRLRSARQSDTTKTLIYSHGNATDIGAMNFMQAVLAKGLHANVIMYDYSGYGASGGEPMEANTYRDIKLVYDFVRNHMVRDRDESKIVLYGQSVGSGPSCYLCAKKPNVGGLVLHSPFMSGMRVLTPSRLLGCLDVFPNIDRIKDVECPVMIIHGELDEEVPITHGRALHDAVPKDLRRAPWWVPGRGHNDLTDGRANLIEYVERLSRFMEGLN
mmetsp:Transcript_19493/g.23225  ORF Transcript_19493/g.23225 Transcript_19493/m.23225 type:complete len:451 (-) Transcript_19493:336-1688(-)